MYDHDAMTQRETELMAQVAALQAKIMALEQQLAETHAHLEAQRTATYQAVKRAHAAGRELALLKDIEKFIKQLAEIRKARKARHEATAT